MTKLYVSVSVAPALAALTGTAWADAGHSANPTQHMSQMGKAGTPGMMGEGMLAFPVMDPARGRTLFAAKGCVVCHSINGIGGEDAPALDATTMPPMMTPSSLRRGCCAAPKRWS